jgi:outer membrane lipoprotein carrier protein
MATRTAYPGIREVTKVRILGYHSGSVELLRAVGITGLLLAAPSLAPGASDAADELARRIEDRHRRASDLTARFVQTYRSGVLGREIVERGELSMKRPGRMRWEYKDPEKKLFVSDGKTFYFYVPADRQVVVREQAGEHGVTTLLLSGQGDILDHFEAALEEGTAGRQRLRLTPRKRDADVDTVLLEVDQTAQIRGIEVMDAQGNRSRFRFENVRENVGLSDKLFRFDIPSGVEVISG